MKQFCLSVLLIVAFLVVVGESRRRVLSRKILQTSCSKKCKGAYNTVAWNEDDTCKCCTKTAIKCKTFRKCKRDPDTGCVSCSCTTTKKSKVTLRVAQGTTAKAGDLPYMVGLVQTGTKDIFCGGGLLSEEWVLTAAHCTQGMAADQIQLFVGGINAKSGPGEFVNAKKIIIHPNYDSQVIINDLSLIQLAKPVKSDGKTISFLGLPADTPPVGSFAIVSGWGLQETKVQPEIIKKALIPVADRQKCIDLFEGYRNDLQFCGGNGSGKDACQGDSGGPIVIRDSSLVANVIGVTSYGTDTCGAKGSMGVYVRIPAFANWIRQQIGIPTTDDITEQVTEEPSVDSSEASTDADE